MTAGGSQGAISEELGHLESVGEAGRGALNLGDLALQGIIGPSLTCQLTGERTHDREVGWCYNNFGSDIGAAIILAGKALACPHYDRRYVALEQTDAIARLPRASYCRARG